MSDGKQCGKCLQVKNVLEFHSDKSKRDGLTSGCKDCNRKRARDWREANLERVREADRSRYRTQPHRAEAAARWRLANPSANKAAIKRWKEENPEAVRAAIQRRISLKKSAPGNGVSAEEWKIILELSEFKCSYCNKNIDADLHMEHVIPLSRGGWHDPCNVVPACQACNLSKGRKTAAEWNPDWVSPFWISLKEFTRV